MSQRIDVAVAVIFNERGQVLWGSRPEGKPYAGYWEFPGGKLETGETVWQALVRELKEELGLLAKEGGPWFVIDHDYEHAKVRLHLYRVWAFEGNPQSLEGQAFKWGALHSDEVAPILPATAPLLPVLNQPKVMAVTNYLADGLDLTQTKLDHALQRTSGHLRVYFRETGCESTNLERDFSACCTWCSTHHVPLAVNSSSVLDLLAKNCPLPSDLQLHVTQEHLMNTPEVLKQFPLVGASVHDSDSLNLAFEKGAQYAVLGAVKQTATHPNRSPLGWSGFSKLVESTKLPVYAIGGLTWEDLLQAQRAGAHGIGMIRGLGD